MTTRNLDKLFSPKSVVLYGASDRTGSMGKKVMENLYSGGFGGPIWLINPKYTTINCIPCYADVDSVPGIPDLAVIAVPPDFVPDIIASLAKKGTRAVVVITAGFREKKLTQPMLDAAKTHCVRILGPNCIGMMVPSLGLNASFAHIMPLKGDLALVSQSGAIISGVLDWATEEGIGFSSMISMGEMADIDLGDILDYLAKDTGTRAILMYLEQVTNPAKFMSAARTAARIKPVIVIKAGRHAAAAKAAFSHTGALAGADGVYNAAFHRAGILRVIDLEDLFGAAETLGHIKTLTGDKLAIVTNGGGAGVLAVDQLIDFKGDLAALTDDTIASLDKILPPTWSKANPVDIIGDAGPERYEGAITTVLEDKNTDAILVINCPTALASSIDAARATISAFEKYNQNNEKHKVFLTLWLGGYAVKEARALFSSKGYPTYRTPKDAVRGFSYLTEYALAQAALMQTPPSLPDAFKTDQKAARKSMKQAIDTGREILTEPEAKAVLKAYGIATVETVIATTADEVEKIAAEIIGKGGTEVVLKILSKDISHKSDIGGVILGLSSPSAARTAAEDMRVRIAKAMPGANIEGFTVQPMISRKGAHELIIGVSEDVTFGPVIMFGAGGTAVEVIKDTAMALPPLDLKLSYDLMQKTRVYKLLEGYRDCPAAQIEAIALTLVRISQMITELPEIMELDINPLLADDKGVIALDARIVVKKGTVEIGKLNPRFVIRPYPKEWEKSEKLPDGKTILVRPIRPEDERYYGVFTQKTDPNDIRLRLFASMVHVPHKLIKGLTQIDYAREMAFVALDPKTDEMVGVSRLISDSDYVRAEFAVITRSDMKGQGIGWALMQRLIHYARSENIQALWGSVLTENVTMLNMCQSLGFSLEAVPDDPTLKHVSISLQP